MSKFQNSIVVTIFKTLFAGKTESNVDFPPDLTFEDKTILVTGATNGLGLEAAILYTNLGAKTVIITARTAAKGENARLEIEQRTGRKDVIQVRVLDMDTFLDVKRFASELRRDVSTIDVVLLNAGIFTFDYATLPDGWEAMLQVNALSSAFLGLLMLQWMKEVRNPGQVQHLCFTGSGTHTRVEIESESATWPEKDVLHFLNEKENWGSGSNMYGVSKLLLQYAMREMAKLAADEDGKPSPIVNSVCPGMIRTNLPHQFMDKSFLHRWIVGITMWLKASPVTTGARTLVLATTTTSAEHGMFRRPYLTDEQYEKSAEKNITGPAGQKMQAEVWREIIEVLKKVDPEISTLAGLQ